MITGQNVLLLVIYKNKTSTLSSLETRNVFLAGPCSELVPVTIPGNKMDVVQTRLCPGLKMFINNYEIRIKYREIGDKFEVSASTACEKVTTVGTDENPSTISGASARARTRCPN